MSDQAAAIEERGPFPFRFAERYEVKALLGRGGMASVYRAWDDALGAAVALKLLAVPSDAGQALRSVELFEREFHALAHLSHPRVVRTYDYGVHAGEPYYSMELLDGGDLRELSPLPWQDVCTVAYEICSALSLLHSRGVVHRDVTPRNIRKTQSGQTKLMDFGLLSPMGATMLLAGTPPFVAPELVRSITLDGRSDLFSLGATLYYALTKRQPYPARTFDQLPDVWRGSPPRPSALVEGVPSALDDLLLGMLRIDPGSRPKSAAEVMERLLPLLSRPPADELRAARAYLVTPKLVGRNDAVAKFRKTTMRAVRGKGGGFAVVGEEGTGRSRMLDAFVLEAKLVGATAVRAGQIDAARPFGVAASITRQIHRAAPAASFESARAHPEVAAILFPDASASPDEPPRDVADPSRSDVDRATLQGALRTFILAFSHRKPLALAIDDIDRIDEPSAALIASLTWEAPSRRLVYAAALSDTASGASEDAIGVLRAHAEEVALAPLSEEQVSDLLASLFGNVPNLNGLAARITAISGGRPRECLTLSQYLVDQGAVTYGGGSWTLPLEIPETILPASLEEASARRIAQLSPLARHVAALLAHSFVERLSRADLRGAEVAPAAELDAAIDELQAARLVSGDPSGYALTGAGVARILTASSTGDAARSIHDELVRLHEAAKRNVLLLVYHGLCGDHPMAALDRLFSCTGTSEARVALSIDGQRAIGTARCARVFELALDWSERLGRPRRDVQSLWVLLAGSCAQGHDPAIFYRIRAAWLDQLKRDSGYYDWEKGDAKLDSSARAMTAVAAAARRYAETPEEDRVLSPSEAIQQLVGYVVFCIPIAARGHDLELQASIADLLAPFAPLNAMVATMMTNARATALNGQGRREEGYQLFTEVLRQAGAVSGAELHYLDRVRSAVLYRLATIDTLHGVPSRWIEALAEARDPNQGVSLELLRKLAALQLGDWEKADAHRQKGELLSLQSKAASMFSTLPEELEVHAAARDLTGLRQVRTAIQRMAERDAGWMTLLQVADAYYHRLCGDLEGALAAAERAKEIGESLAVRSPWAISGTIVAVEALTEQGRSEEALALGLTELGRCEATGMRYYVRGLSRAVAAAEAKLGRFSDALARVEAVVAEQKALGVVGLQLGQSYELFARIALGARDKSGFERFSALAREQYRPGKSSVLGALYERLMDEARNQGFVESQAPQRGAPHADVQRSLAEVTELLAGCTSSRERAERALGLLCDGDPPTRGHLLLCTTQGLELVASNLACDSTTQIVSFARDCVDRETDAAAVETGALLSVAAGTVSAEWHDAQGNFYDPVLLATTISGKFCIGGVALLAKLDVQTVRPSNALAEALAKALISAGDATTVAAA
ncbi:MAG TPA: protein kinase [Polyangiaceae bacterium]|nr:protein kinase [Polyangiaceae bacterium]